jgi:DNA-binding NarL/FixJ family response regulator
MNVLVVDDHPLIHEVLQAGPAQGLAGGAHAGRARSRVRHRACVLAVLQAGAAGFIPKTSSPRVMIAALRLVAAGGIYVPPQALGAHTRSEVLLAAARRGIRLG